MHTKDSVSFLESSMFLCQHKAIGQFAEHYLESYGSNTSYSIVCERKEDVISVRNQLFYEIEKRSRQPRMAISHISMFTLDSLAKNFCATLSSITHSGLKKQIPASLFQPYLEVHLQEHLIELILNRYGYTSADRSALSKQILTLLDMPLPTHINLVEVILKTQEGEHSQIPTQQIHTRSLKQILATFQHAKIELDCYARFQTLTKDYLSGLVFDHLQSQTLSKHLVLPKNILKSSTLWIEAPQYHNVKPGHFQRSLVDEFKQGILKIRSALDFEKKSIFFHSKTQLDSSQQNKSNSNEADHAHCSFRFSENEQDFFHRTKKIAEEKKEFVLLADFDPQTHFRKIRSDGGGIYEFGKKEWDLWRKNEQNSFYLERIKPQIDDLFEQFLSLVSRINHEDQLHQIAALYQIPSLKIDHNSIYDLFYLFSEKEKLHWQDPHPASFVPKALSFFCTERFPEKIFVLGRAHAPVSSSFNVKMLNNAILFLKEEGVDIELPSSDIIYREFWKSLVGLNIPMEFWLASKGDLEEFPRYLTPKSNILPLNLSLDPAPLSHLGLAYAQGKLCMPNWQFTFAWKKNHLSVTQFENYVFCPLQFFLSHLLALKIEDHNEFEINHMDVGSRMHQICEQFITRLVTLFGNEGYLEKMEHIYSNVISTLKQESIFLTSNKETFKQAVFQSISESYLPSDQNEQTIHSFFEAIETIWKKEQNETKSHLVQAEEREILKRCFVKFLHIELSGIQSAQKKKIAIAREFPLSFSLGNFTLKAKIDRVDVNQTGCEIIDYKTSKIPSTEKKLTLLPSDIKKDPKLKLSVQGALYAYGWAQCDHLDSTSELSSGSDVCQFSLYRLKNLDNEANSILSFSFPGAFKASGDFYKKIKAEYEAYLGSLESGDFNPNPIQGKDTCNLCPHTLICPLVSRQNSKEKNGNEANT